MKLIDTIIKECKHEFKEYKKGKPEDAFEYGVLEGRREFADYILFLLSKMEKEKQNEKSNI